MLRVLLLPVCICFHFFSLAQSASPGFNGSLESGFRIPPASAKPRVWWHWMNGNITKEGITKDLEWMKRVGIGGVQLFAADLQTPQVVDKPIAWMTPEWADAMKHAGNQAERLGLEMGAASSGGWSITGGPWVKPEQAMKRIAWSKKQLQGPVLFTGKLSLPKDIVHYTTNGKDTFFYVDTKVLAFRVHSNVIVPGSLNELTTSNTCSILDKAQYRMTRPDMQQGPIALAESTETIAKDSVIDLTTNLKPDGSFFWAVPDGAWIILRIGYTLTGKTNTASTSELRGLEVDKMNRGHVESYMDHYLGSIKNALGDNFGKSFQYFLMDSWEAGAANWTEGMINEFKRLRGYDPTSYLPVLTGTLIGSADISERFLYDFRRTIADLVTENHYEAITNYVQQKGLKGTYAEAIGVEQPTTGDGLQAKGKVTIPMGEFVLEPWRLPGGRETNRADLREAASAAHIYGKGIAAAESFTTTETYPWAQAPYDLKPYADWAMAQGINQFVIHTSAHQPFTDDAHQPGITLSGAGQNYNRNNTWAEQSIAFNNYLARSSWLLQQGLAVADIAYYYGNDAPVVVPYWKEIDPVPPTGYDYDWLNTDVLLNRLTVRDGRLVLPDGMSYRLLVIPADIRKLTLPVIKKLRELVTAGATILAPHPIGSLGLSGYPAADDSVRLIAEEVWGAYGGFRRYHEPVGHPFGRGEVFSGEPVQEVLDSLGVLPDFCYGSAAIDDKLVWIHRRTDSADIYFVANQRPRSMDLTARFRVAGKEPELWDAATGDSRPASYTSDALFTTIPLHLDPRGSVFILFRRSTTIPSRRLPLVKEKLLLTLNKSWNVIFPPNRGAPPSAHFDSLLSWTRLPDSGINYFSGTATYSKDINVSASWFTKGTHLVLDLGAVKEIAEVFVNGKSLGILWKPPFTTDITKALRPGSNHFEIKLTNLWPNRMIGDEQPGINKHYTFAIIKPFNKDSPLLESGLLGPVRIYSRVTETQIHYSHK